MKQRFLLASLLVLGLPLLAHASCDDVKASIDEKIKSHHVAGYSLEVVPSDQADSGGKVVGHCEGDKKIVYARGGDSDSSNSDNSSSGTSSHQRKSGDDGSAPASSGSTGG